MIAMLPSLAMIFRYLTSARHRFLIYCATLKLHFVGYLSYKFNYDNTEYELMDATHWVSIESKCKTCRGPCSGVTARYAILGR